MNLVFGADRALALRVEPLFGVSPPDGASITASLRRVQAMSAAWDEAHDALSRRDCAGFDLAMTKFHREARAAEKAAGHNHGD